MQVLLPPERFEQSIELQPIEKSGTETEDPPNTETPNPVGQSSAVGQQEPHEAENSNATLPEEVSNANRKDDSYISIRAHLEDPTKHAKPDGVKLKGCRVSEGLLMKGNQLWVPDGLQLRVIKEIHDQPAVGHSGVEQTLNMVQRHYYWPRMRQTIEQYVRNAPTATDTRKTVGGRDNGFCDRPFVFRGQRGHVSRSNSRAVYATRLVERGSTH